MTISAFLRWKGQVNPFSLFWFQFPIPLLSLLKILTLIHPQWAPMCYWSQTQNRKYICKIKETQNCSALCSWLHQHVHLGELPSKFHLWAQRYSTAVSISTPISNTYQPLSLGFTSHRHYRLYNMMSIPPLGYTLAATHLNQCHHCHPLSHKARWTQITHKCVNCKL